MDEKKDKMLKELAGDPSIQVTIEESEAEDEYDVLDYVVNLKMDMLDDKHFESAPAEDMEIEYVQLSALEKRKYGDTCPLGFRKSYVIAKGTHSLVWLGKDTKTKKWVILKQYQKGAEKVESQIKVYDILFDKESSQRYDQAGKSLVAIFPGINYLLKIVLN